MNEQTSSENIDSALGRISLLRPLWWIPQTIIINVWEILLVFVLIWQFFYIIVTGETHVWSREFTRKFVNHLRSWIEYTFWVRNERPEIIEY